MRKQLEIITTGRKSHNNHNEQSAAVAYKAFCVRRRLKLFKTVCFEEEFDWVMVTKIPLHHPTLFFPYA